MPNIRVLVVDDHPLMREALNAAIRAEPDMDVAGEAANGQEALVQARSFRPDVIVMDLLMPGIDGIEAIATIRAEMPQTRILAITSSTEEEKVLEAVRAGALGYLLKDVRREELLQAIREVYQGNPYLPPQIALKFIHGVRQLPAETPPTFNAPDQQSHAELTPREKEVLAFLAEGLSNQEIAQRMVVSEATVRSHIYHILGKLHLANRNQAIIYALRQKLTHQSS